MTSFRLNQFLARQLNISRRQADELIKQNLVEVNKKNAGLGQRVGEHDEVKIFKNNFWEILDSLKSDKTILFYKPIFAVTTSFDPQKRKTIYDFLPAKFKHLKPAGRLDYMSEGLLVLSSDGQLIFDLTHPKNQHEKTYLVGLKQELPKTIIQLYSKNFLLDEEKFNSVEIDLVYSPEPKLTPQNYNEMEKGKFINRDIFSSKNLAFLKLQSNFFWYQFTLTEGKNNQIRRMCAFVGQRVLRLIRIKQGNFELTEKLYKEKCIEV